MDKQDVTESIGILEDDDGIGCVASDAEIDKIIEEEKLRKRLKFYFMNPVEKWQNKQRFPFKLLIQLGKIIIVTIQLCYFAQHRTVFIDYVFRNRVAFSHLFIQNWDPSREITTYPPQSGDLALYKIPDFYSAIDFAVENYANLDDAIGPYTYVNENSTVVSMKICLRQVNNKKCSNDNDTLNKSCSVDKHLEEICLNINVPKSNSSKFSSEQFFKQRNILIEFVSLIDVKLIFDIKSSAFKTNSPGCFSFNVVLLFDGSANMGAIKVGLDLRLVKLNCTKGPDVSENASREFVYLSIINSLVIICCLSSAILCVRAIYRAQILKRRTVVFFKKYYNKEVSWKGRCEFLNLWYVTMIVSDMLIMLGSVLKEKIEEIKFSGDELNICSVVLGLGNILVWFSLLRYLSFFKTYNAIILLIKVAAPVLFRFMVCVTVIYAGFTFCGWLVLAPYHMKFRTLSQTSECLFALINGDDVFGTFSTLQPTKSHLIWWFCRIYLYSFVSLFIYVVLSVVFSIMSDAYEAIKTYGKEGFPKSDIREFMEGPFELDICSDSSSSLDGYSSHFPSLNPLSSVTRFLCCGKYSSPKRSRLHT